MDRVATLVTELELKLLNSVTGKNLGELESLLAPEFFEFGSSGKVWERKDILKTLSDEKPEAIEASDFNVVSLSENIMLVTYRAARTSDIGVTQALRSSIWKNRNDRWQLIFHQGTVIPCGGA